MGSGSRQGAEYVMSAIVNNSALRVAAPKKSGPKETMSAETIFPQTRILPYPVQPRNGLKGALPAMGPDVRICENSYKNRKPNTNKKKKKANPKTPNSSSVFHKAATKREQEHSGGALIAEMGFISHVKLRWSVWFKSQFSQVTASTR